MTTKELVENFYKTFAGNKFEASMCKVKEVDGKVAPYFMEDWIEEKFTELEASIRKEAVEELVERSYGWPDAVVDTVEAYALSKGITTLN